MSILGDAKQRLQDSGIIYSGHEAKTDIYGKRVAPGGITNYRMPSFGSKAATTSPEQECLAKGGTWDPVMNLCILSDGEAAEITTGDPTFDQKYADLRLDWNSKMLAENPDWTGYGGSSEAAHSFIDDAFSNWDGTAENNPAFNSDLIRETNLTSDYFNSPEYHNLSYEEKIAKNYEALAGGGVRNVGGSYAQGPAIEQSLAATDWATALENGATPEQIEAAGGPTVSKIAQIISEVAGSAFGGTANQVFEAITGKSIPDLIIHEDLRQQIFNQMSEFVGEDTIENRITDNVAQIDGTTSNIKGVEGTNAKASTDIVKHIKEQEGFSAVAYEDPPGSGNYSIGYGSQTYADGTPVKPGDTTTKEDAEIELQNDVAKATLDAKTNIDNFEDLSPELQTALVSQAYQLGAAGQAGFTKMIDAINKGDWSTAIEEAKNSEWAGQTPKRVEALVEAIVVEATGTSSSSSDDDPFVGINHIDDSTLDIDDVISNTDNYLPPTGGGGSSGGGSSGGGGNTGGYDEAPVTGGSGSSGGGGNTGHGYDEAPVTGGGSSGADNFKETAASLGSDIIWNRGGYVRKNYGGILSKANGGLNHGDPRTHPGKPMGTDRVPLWGEEGEFVMTREGTAKMEQDHPGLLQKYNDYRPPQGTIESAMSQIDDLINKYAQRRG